MPQKKLMRPKQGIETLIQDIRGVRVMLDSDLARIYGVTTKAFNQAVRRNRARFPKDFMFQLNQGETKALVASRSQTVTLKRGQNVKYRPYAFTEHGALQAANVLKSRRAVRMSVFVIRAFVKMRETLLATRDLSKKLATLEKQLTRRLDSHETAIVHVLQELMLILNPPLLPTQQPRPRIGFTP